MGWPLMSLIWGITEMETIAFKSGTLINTSISLAS